MLRKGLKLTILILGKKGTGKSTFMNTLCDQNIFTDDPTSTFEIVDPNPGMKIEQKTIQISEPNSTPISLRVVSVPGFGENLDNSESSKIILDYLEEQFDSILQEEVLIQRNPYFADNRVHAALYFIQATSRGLSELDIDVMKTIGTRVNVIPVLSKADSLTEDELVLNKSLILRDIKSRDIPIYDFVDDYHSNECIYGSPIFALNQMVPFAIAGCNQKRIIRSEQYHVREFPWGDFLVEDPALCEFSVLKTVLFGSHLQDLQDYTHSVLYEQYRTMRLSETEESLPVETSISK